jgi:hypothetical protein
MHPALAIVYDAAKNRNARAFAGVSIQINETLD